MKRMTRPMLAVISALCLTATYAIAQDEDLSKHKLSDWTIGEVLFGENLTDEDLKGKAVVIEHWGVRCPPCIALMPHLATLDRRNRSRGLVIIGAESQSSDKEAIKPILEKAKVEFPITRGARGPIEFSGLPRAFVFNAGGELIYSGHPGDSKFDRAVRDALRSVRDFPTEEDRSTSTEPQLLLASQPWTNAEGREIVAAVKSATETHVIFLLPNGSETAYPLANLSEASRSMIVVARDRPTPADE